MALNDNAYYALRYLQEKHGLTEAQAAGIVGNLMQESTMNTGARNAGDGRDGSDSIGIGQWNGQRARNLRAFGGDSAGQLDTQLDFVMHELRGKGGNGGGSEARAWKQLAAAGDDYVGATKAMISFERPAGWSADNPTAGHGWDNRVKWAGLLVGADPTALAQAQGMSARLPEASGQQVAEVSEPTQASAETQSASEEKKGIFGLNLSLPEEIGGMKTEKLLAAGKDLSKQMAEQQKSQNDLAPQGGLLGYRPVEVKQMQSPRAGLLSAARRPKKEMEPWELQLAMLRGGYGSRGRV